MPVHDVNSALALSTHGSDVETVIVGGELLMHEGRILVLDEANLLAECRAAVEHLATRAGLR
jgi:5-methylthioadenosine/S-adenosylhomocysteine deaminase